VGHTPQAYAKEARWVDVHLPRLCYRQPGHRATLSQPRGVSQLLEAAERDRVNHRGGPTIECDEGQTSVPMSRTISLLLVAYGVGAPALLAQCPDGSPPPCARTAAHAPVPNSIAVLYFNNISRDSNDIYLADGLTEEIISRLGQVERLVVKSRQTVIRYRTRTGEDPASLGRVLGVAYLVNGSVQRSSARVRVRVELVSTVAGRYLWGRTFDRVDRDILAIEDDVAQAVASEIIGRLAPGERAGLTKRPTSSLAAYDHYLKGNFYLTRRESRQALNEYRAALRLDPASAAVLGRLGLAYGFLAGATFPGPGRDSLLSAGFAAANRSLAIDSTTVDGLLARGSLLVPAPDCPVEAPRCLQGAMDALRHALQIEPRNAETWHQYGRACFIAGRFTTADTALQTSLSLEPDRAASAWLLGQLYLLMRRFDEARAMVDSAIALGGSDDYTNTLLSDVKLAQAGARITQADVDSARRWLLRDTVGFLVFQITADARQGDSAAARARLDTLVKRLPHLPENGPDYSGLLALAAGHIAVGSFDMGISLLERLPRNPYSWLWLQWPTWDSVRQDARFRQLEADVRPE